MFDTFFQTDNRKVLKFRLITAVLGVVIIIAAILVSVQLRQTQKNENEFSEFIVKSVAGIEKKKLETIINDIEGTLLMFRDWGMSDLLDMNDEKALNAKLFPIFKRQGLIQAMILADSLGREYRIFHEKDIWKTIYIKRGQNGRVAHVKECTAPDHCTAISMALEYETDDLNERMIASAFARNSTDQIHWTGPLQSVLTGKPAVAAELVWEDRNKQDVLWVVELLINFNDIFDAVKSGDSGSYGVPFLLDADDWNSLSGERKFSCTLKNKDVQTVNAEEVLQYVVSEWQKKGTIPDGAFSFEWMDQKWWIAVSPINHEEKHKWHVGTLIPENAMRKMLRASSGPPVIFYMVLLLAGAGVISWLLWKQGAAFADSAKTVDRRRITSDDIHGIIKDGEGAGVEFKSTMRKNLHSGKFGKEIELAWLKAVVSFMNSKGGTLLIGVDDSGTVLGLDADEFENDDRCGLHFKNLVNQHIGAEFFPFIDFTICPVDGKKIVLVQVRSSDRPVFLTVGGDEAFWVRSGPSNMKLSVSKALQYIETRKKEQKK